MSREIRGWMRAEYFFFSLFFWGGLRVRVENEKKTGGRGDWVKAIGREEGTFPKVS